MPLKDQLSHAHLHGLGRIHATTLLLSGVPVHVVAGLPGHAYSAITVPGLGGVLYGLGDLPAARAELAGPSSSATAPSARTTPASCCHTATSARRCADWGDLPAARAELIRAIELGDRTLGPDHNEVSIDLEALADVQERLGDLLGAAASLRRAQEIRQRNDGADSPHAVELRDRVHELGSRT